MVENIFTDMVIYITIFIASKAYFLGGIFAYLAYGYRLYPVEVLKLFEVMGEYPKRAIIVMYFHLKWNPQENELLHEFTEATRLAAIFWISFSSVYIVLMMDYLTTIYRDENITRNQINNGFWLLLSVFTILSTVRTALKLIYANKTLKASIISDDSSTKAD